MRILALDLGLRTGWAMRLHERVEHGTQEFALQRGDSPGMRFARFNGWLDDLLFSRFTTPMGVSSSLLPVVNLVVFEQPHHRGGAATEVGVGFATRVQERCATLNIEHTGVHTATLKKWLTQNGRANKGEMMFAVTRRFGLKPATDDEADAIALLHYALERFGGAG